MASALPLLVACVLADHADHVLTLHDAAGLAKTLDGCSYFHGLKIVWIWRTKNRAGEGIPQSDHDGFLLLLPEGNPSFGQIVGGHLYHNFVVWQDVNEG